MDQPHRLSPRRADDHVQLLAAIQLTGPIKQNVRASFRKLQASKLFDLNFDALTDEVIAHLTGRHTVLVIAEPSPMPMAAFALSRAVADCFDAPHEQEEQRACAIALGEILAITTAHRWPESDQDLIASATEALIAWDASPSRMNLGPLFD